MVDSIMESVTTQSPLSRTAKSSLKFVFDVIVHHQDIIRRAILTRHTWA